MADNLLDVYDGSEINVRIADEYDETASEWNWKQIEYRRDITPDMPENTRDVYDKLDFRGKKYIRATNNLSIEEEFQGFDSGLYPYKNKQGLVVEVSIQPIEGEAPTDDTRYYTNWNTNQPQWSASDEGEITLTLDGTFDEETDTEPDGTESWANTVS
ncbi:MAG: hypothetical protein ACQEQF_01760 [Bacillota bacterium]